MIDLDDELTRLGDVPPLDPSARAAARSTLLGHDGHRAPVVPIGAARPRSRTRRLARVATASVTAAAAATAITMMLPGNTGVVTIRPASAAAQLEQAAAQAESAPGLQYPVRLSSTTRSTGSAPVADDCTQYLFSPDDSVHDCTAGQDGLRVLAVASVPGPATEIAFAAGPDEAKAALERLVAANVDQRRRTGFDDEGEAAVRVELVAAALRIPQMDGAIRSMLLRELATAPDLRAEPATTPTGDRGTRFTATYPHGASIAVTIDDAGYVRETTHVTPQLDQPTATVTSTLGRPVPAGELPADVAAVRDEVGRRAAEIEGDFGATSPLVPSDTSMTYACAMVESPADLPTNDGTRTVIGVHCFNPATPNR